MSFEMARKIADAVLCEGYVLYPYRPSSLKNRFRWQFGVVAPPNWESDPSFMQTECLIEPHESPVLDVMVRFLQVQAKTDEWDEGVERTVELRGLELKNQWGGPPGPPPAPGPARSSAATSATGGSRADRGVRPTMFEFAPVRGVVRVSAEPAGRFLKLRVRIENTTGVQPADRNEAMRYSLTGAHTLLELRGGAFVSALDAQGCENLHTWPVLVGRPGERSVMLSSPIILQDYPAIAAESPGDFFDGTEIDEMLTLRVMTMTEEEKREAAATDERSRRIIERVENMPREQMEKLHGAIRSLGEDARFSKGERVRLAPRRRADAMDLFLAGRTARVEKVERDFENRVYVAVSVEGDPAAEVYGRFYYFYPDELEPVAKEN